MKRNFLPRLLCCLMLGIPGISIAARTAEPNLIANPGFEDATTWQTQLRSGAQGQGAFDATQARSGKQSFKLVKRNGLGIVELRTTQPIHIEPNVLYTFRGWFRSDDAPISSVLLFRISRDGKRLTYNAIDRTAGFKSQSLIPNSPAGEWTKRVVTYRSAKAEDIYLHVALWGNPCTVYLDDLELTKEPYKISSEPVTFKFPYSKEQVIEALEKRPQATAQVVRVNGRMQLQVNGKGEPFVFYKGMGASERGGDYEGFAQAGVSLASVALRLGESQFAYDDAPKKAIWEGRNKINFDAVDDIIANVLRRNPQANLILEMWAYPYRDWGVENPEEVVRNEKGEKAYGFWGNLDGYTDDISKVAPKKNKPWYYPSYQSEKWRHDSMAAMAAIARHLKSSPYGKAVVGFFISGGQDLRFVPHFHDYSKPSRESFRHWLLEKYGSVEAIARAWGQPLKSLDAIEIPVYSSKDSEFAKPYQGPGPLIDYREFKDKGTWDLRDLYAETVKREIGKPVVTLCYAAPVSENFLHTKWLDAAGDMSYYPYRNPGYALSWVPGDGFDLHDKIFMQEIDLRSWKGSRYAELYQIWVGAGLTPDSWDSVHRKMLGVSLAHGYGWWYYDMGRYFADPVMHRKIGQAYQVARRVSQMPAGNFRPDVCVVAHDFPDSYLADYYSAVEWGVDYQDMMLESSGVPFEKHYLNDILTRPDLQNFKVYIFQQNIYITEEQRREIAAKLKNRNRTIVWMYDTGYISEKGKSAAAMSELTGIQIGTQEEHRRSNAIISPSTNPLLRGVPPLLGTTEMLMTIFAEQGRNSNISRSQPFWIEEAEVKPLATFVEDGKNALGVKQFADWTSLYIAAPNGLDAVLLHNIAQQAGAYVAGSAGAMLHMNGNFASLHGLRSGEYELRLPPGKKKVIEALTGNVLAQDVATYKFQVEAQKTYWFLFE